MIPQTRSLLCLTALTLPTAGCGSLEVAAAGLGIVGGGLGIGVASAEKENLKFEQGLQAKEAELQQHEQRNLTQAEKIAETELAVASKELELLNRGAGHKLTISGDIAVTVRAVTPDGSVVPAAIKQVSVTPAAKSGGLAVGDVTPESTRELAKFLRRDRRKDAENPQQALNPLTTISVGREVLVDLEIRSPPAVQEGQSAADQVLPSIEAHGGVKSELPAITRWSVLAGLLLVSSVLVTYARRPVGRPR